MGVSAVVARVVAVGVIAATGVGGGIAVHHVAADATRTGGAAVAAPPTVQPEPSGAASSDLGSPDETAANESAPSEADSHTAEQDAVIPADLEQRVQTAAAQAADLRVGISVLDPASGERFDAGDTTGEFGAASVVKVLMAARLLAEGRMTGETEQLATAMIERSDDNAGNVLWSLTGMEDLEPWAEAHWGIANLGSPNEIDGRWGNTHFTASGLAELYAALQADPAVWPWLSAAMHLVNPVAADGTDQTFGIYTVDPTAAIKQGWADGSADDPADAVVNSTGFVANDRLIVVILTEGNDNNGGTDGRGYNAEQAQQVTAMAQTILG